LYNSTNEAPQHKSTTQYNSTNEAPQHKSTTKKNTTTTTQATLSSGLKTPPPQRKQRSAQACKRQVTRVGFSEGVERE
jgi:hypothetical protein